MDGFVERLERLVITVTSPDGSVRGEFRDGRATVDLRPGRLPGHTEASLSRELSATLTSLQRGYQHALSRIFEAVREGRPAPDLADSPVGRRKRAFDAEVAEVETRAGSPRGLVEVRYRGAARMDVRIAPGALGRAGVGANEIADEVDRAVAESMTRFDERYVQVRKSLYERGLWQEEGR